jgi:outer membrane protein
LQLSIKNKILRILLFKFAAIAISGHLLFIPFSASAETDKTDTLLLKSIRIANLESGNVITVQSNGEINEYTSFTLDRPARIVFDLFNVKSPYKKPQKMPVASEWIDQVRHYGHRDKLRIVVDTKKAYLTAFSAVPVETGLVISIGKEIAVSQPDPDQAAPPEIIESISETQRPVSPESKTPEPDESVMETPLIEKESPVEGVDAVDEAATPDLMEIVGDRLNFLYEGKPSKPFTLKNTVETALAANIGIKISKEEAKATLAVKKSQRTNFYPTIGGTYQYNRFDEGANIGGFAMGSQDQFKLSATITQQIFNGFSLINQYKIASLGHDIAKINANLQRQDVILQAKAAYFNLLKAQKLRDISEQTVKQISAQKEVAENFYKVGMSPLNDFLQADVELANAKQDSIVAGNNLITAKSDFNTLLRRPINSPVQIEDILSYAAFGIKLDESQQTAENNRLELKLSDLEIRLADKEVDLSKKDFFPSVDLRGAYVKEGTEPNLNGGAGVFDPEGWVLSATASWDIWEWGKKSYGVKEKLARLEQAKQRKTELLDQIRLEVKRAYLKNLETEINIITIQKAIAQAKENLRINQERFKEQVATTTDVLNAQTLLAETMTRFYTALYDFKISKAALYRAMGQEVIQ